MTEPVPDPIAVEASPSLSVSAGIDAPLDIKAASFAPTLGAPVRGPGQAETAAAAPVGPRTAVRGQPNWVSIGPRNVGGRVRAIAVEPGDPKVMYAAPASGGVFKSVDGGDSWFPLWHDEPSLSMAALAISPSNHAVVWAGTGETQAGGGETIPAAGVWRSENRGETWRAPNAGQTILTARIHALAAHPTKDAVCWAAATGQRPGDPAAGLYRSTDGGLTWSQFAAGRGFTDVRFARFGGTLRLFAVPQGTVQLAGPPVSNRALLIRLDTPDDSDPTLAGVLNGGLGPPDSLLAVGTPAPALAAGAADPEFGKVAVYEGGNPAFPDPVVYLALTHENLGQGSYSAIFRCRDAHSKAATAMTFTVLPPAETFGAEGQGGYNIAIAVSPDNPNHLAFGMVELYLHRNAAAATPVATDWLRAQMWDLNIIDAGHHADHHDLLFANAPAAPFDNGVPGSALVLWDANDGGVSWCADWATARTYPLVDTAAGPAPRPRATAEFPPPLDAMTWRKRSHGISATQMYDLTQHPRLPSVIGCGFQDNGVWLGLSGPSWQLALTADGGFVAFDPDNPYRMIVTYQEGITEARFPGRLRSALPLPRDAIQNALWPRDLQDGFLDSDGALFTAATAFHPRLPGRVLTARRHRLYGTRSTTGDRWSPEPLGTGFEIIHRPAQANAGFSVLEVLDTPGGRALGLLPQRTVTVRDTGGERHAESRVRSVRPGPYQIGPGLDLRLIVSTDLTGVAPIPVTVPLTVGATLPASADAAQVASYLTAQFAKALAPTPAAGRPLVRSLPVVLPAPRELVIASTAAGAASQVVLSGTALSPGGPLNAVARAYHGADAGAGPGAGAAALPSIAPIMVDARAQGMNLAGLALRVTREGGASQVDIDFDVELPPPASSHVSVGQLHDVLRRRLPSAAYELWTASAFRGLRLTSTATPPTAVSVLGNLVTVSPGATDTDIALVPTTPNRTRRMTGRDRQTTWLDTLDLSQLPGPPPADRTLRLRETGNQTALQALTAGFLGVTDLTRITTVELCDAVRRMLAGTPAVRIRCDLEMTAASLGEPNERAAMGEVTELAFGPPGSRFVFAGDSAGRIYRSTDDGEHWEHRVSPLDELLGPCEAIAIQSDNTDVVLAGLYAEGGQNTDAVMLFRSTDGGTTFVPAAQIDNGLPGAARRVFGVRALVFDPGAPGHVYAATDIGVHHSPDAGRSWEPFNSGLPNVRVSDLSLAVQTRVLRAGCWGRGVYERRLDPAGVRDVLLHIRTTGLDDGTAQPTPGPDLLAVRPESVRFDASPDIKLHRHDPRRGAVLDGAEFDDELTSEDVRVGAAFLTVQVHNRGAFPTPAPASPPNPAGPLVRVTALWVPADAGPPAVPPELWPALANPVAVGTKFGPWTVLGDEPITGPAGAAHEIVAPGYPRVVVMGATAPFSWPALVEDHRRIGIIAITRSDDDPLGPAPTRPVGVLELIQTQAKIGYRECDVIPAAEDDQVVLRTLDGSSIAIVAVPGTENAATGGAPFGLSAIALPGAPDVRFATAGPYALPARRRFQIQVRTTATVTFAPDDPELPNLNRTFASDAANVLNRGFMAAGVPVRAARLNFVPGPGNDALRLSTLSTTRVTVAGPAAATFGLTAGGAGFAVSIDTPLATRGPWNLTPAAPRSLTVTATTTVEIRLQAGQNGLPAAGPVSAAAIRTAINQQLARGGLAGVVVCEPARHRLSVRRSATEPAAARQGAGSAALADLVSAPAPVAAGAARDALFDVVATYGQDTIAAAGNHLYLRAANIGNTAEAAVRHRLFLLDTSVTPLTPTPLGAEVVQPLAAGAVHIVEFAAVAVPGVAAGDHRFVLAIADVNSAGQAVDPAANDLASLDALLEFCQRHPGAAVREFVGR